jgi:hypothetical protein
MATKPDKAWPAQVIPFARTSVTGLELSIPSPAQAVDDEHPIDVTSAPTGSFEVCQVAPPFPEWSMRSVPSLRAPEVMQSEVEGQATSPPVGRRNEKMFDSTVSRCAFQIAPPSVVTTAEVAPVEFEELIATHTVTDGQLTSSKVERPPGMTSGFQLRPPFVVASTSGSVAAPTSAAPTTKQFLVDGQETPSTRPVGAGSVSRLHALAPSVVTAAADPPSLTAKHLACDGQEMLPTASLGTGSVVQLAPAFTVTIDTVLPSEKPPATQPVGVLQAREVRSTVEGTLTAVHDSPAVFVSYISWAVGPRPEMKQVRRAGQEMRSKSAATAGIEAGVQLWPSSTEPRKAAASSPSVEPKA